LRRVSALRSVSFFAGLELLQLIGDLFLLLEQSRHFVSWIETGHVAHSLILG
jgi:hypothetical protein